MSIPRSRLIVIALLTATVVVAVILVIASQSHPTTTAGTPTSTSSDGVSPVAWNLSTCGPVEQDAVTVTNPATQKTVAIKATVFYPFGCPTSTTGCHYSTGNIYPDLSCTPGAIYDLSGVNGPPNTDPSKFDAALTRSVICASGTSGLRHVTATTKAKVYADYGVKTHNTGQYEVDHVISLELGGANVIGNLAPEPAAGDDGFHHKDVAENNLGVKLCAPGGSLEQVDDAIMHHWTDYAVGKTQSTTDDDH